MMNDARSTNNATAIFFWLAGFLLTPALCLDAAVTPTSSSRITVAQKSPKRGDISYRIEFGKAGGTISRRAAALPSARLTDPLHCYVDDITKIPMLDTSVRVSIPQPRGERGQPVEIIVAILNLATCELRSIHSLPIARIGEGYSGHRDVGFMVGTSINVPGSRVALTLVFEGHNRRTPRNLMLCDFRIVKCGAGAPTRGKVRTSHSGPVGPLNCALRTGSIRHIREPADSDEQSENRQRDADFAVFPKRNLDPLTLRILDHDQVGDGAQHGQIARQCARHG
jgi:hypothetical protein